MINIVRPDFEYSDDRGSLIQLVHKDFEQFNIIKTKKGVCRGGHYHKNSIERFYIISGRLELHVSKNNTNKKYILKKDDYFEVSPYTIHSMYFLEDCIMISMYNKCVEYSDGTKDIFESNIY